MNERCERNPVTQPNLWSVAKERAKLKKWCGCKEIPNYKASDALENLTGAILWTLSAKKGFTKLKKKKRKEKKGHHF